MFDWKKYENLFDSRVKSVLEWMQHEFSRIRVGRADPMILNDILVDAYDEKTKINQIANISVPEARILIIKPYDRSLLKNISSAIAAANIGIHPQIDADLIRLTFPAPTEETRKECLKKLKLIAEEAKVGIRKARQHVQEEFKKDIEVLEDDKKYFQTQLDKVTKDVNKLIENNLEIREKEIMTI